MHDRVDWTLYKGTLSGNIYRSDNILPVANLVILPMADIAGIRCLNRVFKENEIIYMDTNYNKCKLY